MPPSRLRFLIYAAATLLCLPLLSEVRRVMSPRTPDENLAARPPALYIPNSICDLGHIDLAEEIEVPFVLYNRGHRRLVVNRLGCQSCGSNHSPQTVVIPPNQSAKVWITLDTRGARGFVESVTDFKCNDPQSPRFVLVTRAKVRPAAAGRIGQVPVGTTTARRSGSGT